MNIIRALLIVSIAGGGYTYWKDHHPAAAQLRQQGFSEFIRLPPVEGQHSNVVFVVAAQNCPHADAKRADRIAEDLSNQGVPVERTNSAQFHFTEVPTKSVVDRMNAIMTGPLPIVFINGRAKSNPSVEEVIAEFATHRNRSD